MACHVSAANILPFFFKWLFHQFKIHSSLIENHGSNRNSLPCKRLEEMVVFFDPVLLIVLLIASASTASKAQGSNDEGNRAQDQEQGQHVQRVVRFQFLKKNKKKWDKGRK